MKTSASWNLARFNAGAWALLIAGMLVMFPVLAIDITENVQVHGFASQAFIKTSANKYFGRSDAGSSDFRELGVNFSWQATPSIQWAAQIGSRRAGGTDDATPRIDLALVDFTLASGEAGRAGLRVGRHRIPLGLYNLTRDVANARPSIILPESIYSDHTRSLVLAMDGMQVYEELRTSIGDFFFDGGTGNFILDNIQKRTGTSATSYIWRLMYEHDGGRLRLALTGFDANLDAIAPPFRNPKFNLNFHLLSAQYNAENWSLTGEFAPSPRATYSKLIVPGFPPIIPDIVFPDLRQTGQSGYVQGTYNITPSWTALLRYDVNYLDRNDRSGAKTAAATFGATPAHSLFTKDWTVGIAWKVRPDTKIRAEWHHLNGTSWLSSRENPSKAATAPHWEMFALQASYSF